MEYCNIPSACLYAEHSMILDAPLKQIYRMLTDVNAEQIKDQFSALYPVPIVKTLGNLCYILNDEGVEKRQDGSDSFTDSLTILRQECDAEVRRLTKQRIAFNSLKALTMVGLGVTPVSELYLLKMIISNYILIYLIDYIVQITNNYMVSFQVSFLEENK